MKARPAESGGRLSDTIFMLDPNILLILGLAIVGAVLCFLAIRHLGGSRGGRWALLFATALLPLAASAASFRAGITESSRTRFCLSCHEMQTYGRSLFADNRKALSAVHYQERLVTRDSTCFSCHTDYAMFGDLRAKLNGLRHVYVHYVGTIPAKPKLYHPFPNQNCLHCHEDARRFLEQPAHRPVAPELHAGTRSCLQCHAVGHDLGAADQGRLWQAGVGR